MNVRLLAPGRRPWAISFWKQECRRSALRNLNYPVRRGFSLFELILVLIILVTLAGFAIPTLDAMVTSRRLTQSAERLQNELLEARIEAMKTGQAQVFRATIHGNGYTISPWLSGREDSDASAGATIMSTGGAVKTERTRSGSVASTAASTDASSKTLDTDVLFLGIETLVDARNAMEIQKSGEMVPGAGTSNASGSASSPLLLYPDGSSTTGQIILADKRGRRMAILIRGITGRSTSVRLSSVDASTIPSVVTSATSATSNTSSGSKGK
ncbi:MAG: prepilin-type N-terminal cleavage/methylation domain-containing protein [Planctomycetota bacterium]